MLNCRLGLVFRDEADYRVIIIANHIALCATAFIAATDRPNFVTQQRLHRLFDKTDQNISDNLRLSACLGTCLCSSL